MKTLIRRNPKKRCEKVANLPHTPFITSLGAKRARPRAGAFVIDSRRVCGLHLGENYAFSAGFFLSFTGSVKQAPERNMFFTTYDLYDIL